MWINQASSLIRHFTVSRNSYSSEEVNKKVPYRYRNSGWNLPARRLLAPN